MPALLLAATETNAKFVNLDIHIWEWVALLAFITVGYNLYQLATVRIGPSRPRKAAGAQTSQPHRPVSAWDDDEQDEDDDWPVQRRTDG